MARAVRFSFLRGGGSSLEVLYGKVSLTPTNLHTLSTTAVLPAPTTFDLINGVAVATNVAPTPEPVDGAVAWAYKVKVTDTYGKSWEYLVGVPDGTTEINFNVLPRYTETRPPAYGVGPAGPAGQSATIAIGTTTSGPTPAVNNSGTSTNAILDFTLAQGPIGPKGDGIFFADTTFDALPSTYATGITIGNASTANGWPASFVLVTTEKRYNGRTVQRLVDVNNTYIQQRTELGGAGANTWSPLKTVAWDAEATASVKGLLSAADKAKLDNLTLANNSKTFAALASTYPVGFSTTRVQPTDGWPVATGAQVVTTKTLAGNGGVSQWVYPEEGGTALFRSTSAAGVWSTLQPLATLATISARDSVNVKDFGVIADGVADDTANIQAAIAAAQAMGVRKVYFPGGTYLINSAIVISSDNLTLIGYGARIISGSNLASVFSVVGTGVVSEFNTSANFDSGTSNIATTAANGFVVGDTLRLVGQRVSTSLDAPYADRLGGDTGDGSTNTGPYFGEFLRVGAVTSTTAFQTTTKTIFNGYRINATQDPTTDRPRTTIQKMGMVRNVTIRGFDLDVVAGTTINVQYAENILIVDVSDIKRHSAGTSYAFYGCLDATVRTSSAKFTSNLGASGTLTQRTLYKTVSSQNVTFDTVSSDWGGQTIDATFLRNPWLIPNINFTVRNSKIGNSLANPLTTHPGTWMVTIDSNDFTAPNGVDHPVTTNSGIAIRTPKSVITNNRLKSYRMGGITGQDGNYGISFQDGAGKEFIVEGNTVEGYDRGIFIGDGAIAERRYGYVNGLIANNRLTECFTGVVTSRSTASTENPNWDITITGNVFQNNIAKSQGIWLDVQNGGSKGFYINNNTFIFSNSFAGADACTPVLIGRSVSDVVMANNNVRGGSIYAMWGVWAGGGALATERVITDLQNSVLASAAHRYEAPTGVFTLNATPGGGGYLGLPLVAHSLNNFIGNFELVKTTGAFVTTANGYPFDGVTGYLDGKLGASGQAIHTYTTMENPPRMVRRRRDTSGAWGTWT